MTSRRVLLLVLAASLANCKSPTAPASAAISAAESSMSAPGRQLVTTPGDGVTLGGILFRPTAPGARPAVVILHGWQSAGTNGAAVVEARARRYAEAGFVALALSMRGWPPSGGADDCGLRQPDDVAAAVAWLRILPGVDPQRVALVGFSQGGQVALLAAARGAGVRAVVAYFPVTDVALWKTSTTNADIPGYIAAVCEPGGLAARSPRLHAAQIGVPVLLLHGDRDTRVPTQQSHLMAAALLSGGRQGELFLVPGAQHGFTAAEDALTQPVVDAFLASALR